MQYHWVHIVKVPGDAMGRVGVYTHGEVHNGLWSVDIPHQSGGGGAETDIRVHDSQGWGQQPTTNPSLSISARVAFPSGLASQDSALELPLQGAACNSLCHMNLLGREWGLRVRTCNPSPCISG